MQVQNTTKIANYTRFFTANKNAHNENLKTIKDESGHYLGLHVPELRVGLGELPDERVALGLNVRTVRALHKDVHDHL